MHFEFGPMESKVDLYVNQWEEYWCIENLIARHLNQLTIPPRETWSSCSCPGPRYLINDGSHECHNYNHLGAVGPAVATASVTSSSRVQKYLPGGVWSIFVVNITFLPRWAFMPEEGTMKSSASPSIFRFPSLHYAIDYCFFCPRQP